MKVKFFDQSYLLYMFSRNSKKLLDSGTVKYIGRDSVGDPLILARPLKGSAFYEYKVMTKPKTIGPTLRRFIHSESNLH